MMTPRDTLIEYLLMKVAECDWHAVADAAMDLRVLEAQIAVRAELEAKLEP